MSAVTNLIRETKHSNDNYYLIIQYGRSALTFKLCKFCKADYI